MPTTHLAHRFSYKSGPNPPTKYTSGYIESWGKPACQKPLGRKTVLLSAMDQPAKSNRAKTLSCLKEREKERKEVALPINLATV